MSNDQDQDKVEAFFASGMDSMAKEKGTEDEDVFGDLYGSAVDGNLNSAAGKTDRGVIKIGKRRFAVGLYWSSVPDGEKPATEALKVASEDPSTFIFYCVRNTAVPQFALAHSAIEGYQNGDISLAAMLSDNHPGGDWIGAFALDDGFYLCAVRKGQILPGIERFYLKSDSAQSALEELMEFGDWTEVIAPASWGIPGANQRPIEEFLGKRASCVLKPVSSRIQVLRFLILASIIGASAAAVYFTPDLRFIETFNGDAIRTEMDQALEQVQITIEPVVSVNLSDIIKDDEVEVPPSPPWIGHKNGVGTLISCQSEILGAFSSIPGWSLTSVNCTEGYVSIMFSNAGGTVPEAEAWAKKYFREDVNLSDDLYGESFSLSFPTSYVTPYAADIDADDIDAVERYLRYWFISLGEPIQIERSNDTSSLEGRYYEKGTIQFTTGSPPASYAPIFSRLPGFIIDGVNYRPSSIVGSADGDSGGGSLMGDGEWSIQGSYYKKRDTPIPAPQSN